MPTPTCAGGSGMPLDWSSRSESGLGGWPISVAIELRVCSICCSNCGIVAWVEARMVLACWTSRSSVDAALKAPGRDLQPLLLHLHIVVATRSCSWNVRSWM